MIRLRTQVYKQYEPLEEGVMISLRTQVYKRYEPQEEGVMIRLRTSSIQKMRITRRRGQAFGYEPIIYRQYEPIVGGDTGSSTNL